MPQLTNCRACLNGRDGAGRVCDSCEGSAQRPAPKPAAPKAAKPSKRKPAKG